MDEIVTVGGDDAIAMARRLLREEGLYDYLLAFVGQGELASVERLGLRWVGAFTDIIAGRDGNSS